MIQTVNVILKSSDWRNVASSRPIVSVKQKPSVIVSSAGTGPTVVQLAAATADGQMLEQKKSCLVWEYGAFLWPDHLLPSKERSCPEETWSVGPNWTMNPWLYPKHRVSEAKIQGAGYRAIQVIWTEGSYHTVSWAGEAKGRVHPWQQWLPLGVYDQSEENQNSLLLMMAALQGTEVRHS